MQTPKRSPWGTVDGVKEIAPGILSVTTPGHGGLKLSRSMNAKMPKAARRKGGWYEEDCEWALVALVFPETYPDDPSHVTASVKNWFPDAYEAITGEKVATEDSYVLRERAFKSATATKFVVVCARGDWASDVPTGMVGVTARKASTGATAEFLVTAAEYAQRDRHGFVVDESRHAAL